MIKRFLEISEMETSVIIMAGGLGKRMKSDLPKVLHLVNQQPMIVKVLQTAIQLDPKQILIVVGKYRTIIQSTIKKYINYPIIYVNQEEPRGTANAVQCCLPYLTRSQKVFILSGDVPLISKDTLVHLMDQTDQCGMVVAKFDRPDGLGRILTQESKFIRIIEDKDCSKKKRRFSGSMAEFIVSYLI
jgi:bifunctional N-acetylglucosamine-1-phosphate-uridyltransferase/glucosamine-1-phosphate-acetyltransferase GlmU-like protein